MTIGGPTTFRLTSEDREILDYLTARTSLTQTQVLRVALREMRDRIDASSPRATKRATKRK